MEQNESYETFEVQATTPLEKYEWDDIWFDHATDTATPRVIVFGDSITVNFRFPLIEALRGEFCVDNYGTSKAADNPFLLQTMRLVLAQQPYRIIHFRTGHGTHQTPQEYAQNTEKLVRFFLQEHPDKKLILSLKTYRSRENSEVVSRNEAICRIAEKYGLPVDDLYTITENRPDLLKEDGVHLNEAGKELVARHVAQTIRAVAETL